jgi:raffinose/stachyose/melibiose transport system permease protein
MLEKKKGFTGKVVSIIMWIYSLSIVFILGYVFYNSLRSRSDIISNTLGKPESLSFTNYVQIFVNDNFQKYFFNSLIILVLSLILLVFLSSMVAYGLGRYKFRFNKGLRIFFLLGMMFPVQLGIVPIFLMMKGMHLIDSYTSVVLILGTGISMPVFMLTDFFAKLPNEMYEAAIIDGAGEWTTFIKIMFPLAKPIVFSVCIVGSVQIWNQFFIPLIFLQSDDKQTVPLLVVKYTQNLLNTVNLGMAASVMSILPILIVFVIFSKRILEGFASGGVKG